MIRSKLIIAISLMILVSISSVLAVVSITGRAAEVEVGSCLDTDGNDPRTGGVVLNFEDGKDRLIQGSVDRCVTKNRKKFLIEGVCHGSGRNGRPSSQEYVITNNAINGVKGYCKTEDIEVQLKNDRTGAKPTTRRTVSVGYWKVDDCSVISEGSVSYNGETKIVSCSSSSTLVKYGCNDDTSLKTETVTCQSNQLCQNAACVARSAGSLPVPNPRSLQDRFDRLVAVLCQKDPAYCGM